MLGKDRVLFLVLSSASPPTSILEKNLAANVPITARRRNNNHARAFYEVFTNRPMIDRRSCVAHPFPFQEQCQRRRPAHRRRRAEERAAREHRPDSEAVPRR